MRSGGTAARVAAKRLRFATEFFASLYPKQGVRHHVAALSRLQDDLGRRSDVVVADGLLTILASERQETAAGTRGTREAILRPALRPTMKRYGRCGSALVACHRHTDRFVRIQPGTH